MILTSVTLSPTDRDRLETYYTFRERSQVLDFLEKFPSIVSILLAAPEKIYRHFPENTPLILEIAIDPEYPSSEDEELTLLIASDLDPDESLQYLWQLDRDLDPDDLSQNEGKLLINIGY
ncbi:MAG: hypothetical protein AB4290_03025 [Spirulina sp.]